MPAPPYISLRTRPSGGWPRDEVQAHVPEGEERLILLVHGFNTTEEEAAGAYQAFHDHLSRQAPRLARALCPVFWPGDAAMRGGAYPWLVQRAKICGALFANWLTERLETHPGPMVIVAHSLGCRMTLEAVARLSDAQSARLRLFLMAAAVPVGLVEAETSLAAAVARTAGADALHSRADGVLDFWFRLGQSAAPGEEGLLPEAVGLRGGPERSVWTLASEMPGYDHDQYWSGHRMATHLANRLGAAVAKPRPVRLAAPARLAPVRPAPEPRPHPKRRIADHYRQI